MANCSIMKILEKKKMKKKSWKKNREERGKVVMVYHQ